MKKPKLVLAALVLLVGAAGAVMPKHSSGSHHGENLVIKASKGRS